MEKIDIFNSIDRSDKVCIIAHVDPDVDALSSLVLVKDFLKRILRVKTVDIFAESKNLPESYEPIVKRANLNPNPSVKYNVAISVDCPSIARLGSYADLFNKAETRIVIDHHATNCDFGTINYVKQTSSTCEIIYDILLNYGHKFSKQNYGMIYAGIITDTNNFTVGNLNKRTYEVAGECIAHVDPKPIYKQFMNNHTLKNMQLLSLAINNITSYNSERLIMTHITTSDATRYLANDEDYLGIVNRIAAISNCSLVCFVYPKGEGYYVSMRAGEGYSVSEIAKKFGGGGHHGAAAFESNLSPNEIKDLVLPELLKELEKTNDSTSFKF